MVKPGLLIGVADHILQRIMASVVTRSPELGLPQEVIERIIDEVATSLVTKGRSRSIRALQNCSLTCKSFLPRSSFHLFHHLVHHKRSILPDSFKEMSGSHRISTNIVSLAFDFADMPQAVYRDTFRAFVYLRRLEVQLAFSQPITFREKRATTESTGRSLDALFVSELDEHRLVFLLNLSVHVRTPTLSRRRVEATTESTPCTVEELTLRHANDRILETLPVLLSRSCSTLTSLCWEPPQFDSLCEAFPSFVNTVFERLGTHITHFKYKLSFTGFSRYPTGALSRSFTLVPF